MIGVLGISHKNVPLEIREQFHFSTAEADLFSENALHQTEITEIVVLSTCNRTEIYFYHDKSCKKKTTRQLIDLVFELKGITEDYTNLFYTHTNKMAVQHLFEVTAGLDSMVIGENQIVKQVKESYLNSVNNAYVDAVLMRLFQKSFETSKRVRTQTNIQYGATSLSYIAADTCQKTDSTLASQKILVIGTGETGQSTIHHLIKLGAENIIITNRTAHKAQQLADKAGVTYVAYNNYKSYLPDCNIVITATRARTYLLNAGDIQQYDPNGANNQLFIDLSVPRNINPNLGTMPNKKLMAVDDLQKIIDTTNQIRKESLNNAQQIIDLMVKEYYEWLENRKLRPIIKKMTQNVQKIHLQELELSKPCYTNEQYKYIEEYSGRLSKKVINALIKQLKEIYKDEEKDSSLNKIQELFTFNEN